MAMQEELNLLVDTLYEYTQLHIFRFVSKFVVAIVILLIGFILGRFLGKVVYKLLHSFQLNEGLNKLGGMQFQAEELAEGFTTYFIYFITVVMVLQQMGIATTILNMIAGAVILIIILSTFLGIKDFIPNAMAGLVIQSKKVIREGETIKVKGMQGKIIHISLVETKLETNEGDIIFVPNSVITRTSIIKVKVDKKPSKKIKK
ncbi:mechanosensitive ion channel [Candidatus Woesearchaeota archaeon]|jgi:small conductance mechanosensitive channel|nr:mechanosensitive ion channel [Candidatus Woesearchaeota archaeon]MBT6520142.1 mechanosensitive ion channel [Candidatus Woesearchaeota archaeon]MBT7366747.1 mechanosensitive ion channel [Candidatus Woesearchaeota archaeon]